MADPNERCRRGHLIAEVGRRDDGYCRGCARENDRKRGPAKRQKAKWGGEDAPRFTPGQAYIYDRKGFSWKHDFIADPTKLRAFCEWALRANPDQRWARLLRLVLKNGVETHIEGLMDGYYEPAWREYLPPDPLPEAGTCDFGVNDAGETEWAIFEDGRVSYAFGVNPGREYTADEIADGAHVRDGHPEDDRLRLRPGRLGAMKAPNGLNRAQRRAAGFR